MSVRMQQGLTAVVLTVPTPMSTISVEEKSVEEKDEEEEEAEEEVDHEDETGSDDESDDDDDELSELSDEEEGGDDSLRVPVTIQLVTGATVTVHVDPNRTTVRRLMKLALAQQAPGYSKSRQKLWLTNGGANGNKPLKKGKKLADYGIGPNRGVMMQYNYQKNKCCECCLIGCLITAFLLTCGACCWGCGCFSRNCRRRYRRCCGC